MRIIAGKFKGRRLNAPKDSSIRPTADKVREAIFSMIDGYLEDAVVIDLFSGSGAPGLEALSRGARVCYFCDNSRESIRLIKSNIDICGAKGESFVIHGDFRKALSMITEKADIIFLDPPYENDFFGECFEKIQEYGLLKEGGIVAAERRKTSALPETLSNFSKIKEKKYGTVSVSLYVELNPGMC